MPFTQTKAPLILDFETQGTLETISRSRSESQSRVQRASILLRYAQGSSVSEIARSHSMSRSAVNRVVNRALEVGALAALKDLKRSGRPRRLSMEARAWVVALACQKPKELGYPHELWTIDLLVRHVRSHCQEAGHPSLARISGGTISKILSGQRVRAHKVRYYLERRDPDFDRKMVQILHVYKEIELLHEKGEDKLTVVISCDEKPGIQAIESKGPDLAPVPGQYPQLSREFEYIRHGTTSLIAGMDLMSGHVHHLMPDRHRSREFVEFLKLLDQAYPPETKIRLILDNHSAHTSKETRSYLQTVPNRFEFIFTPVHGSWLNLIEGLFSKMARSVLRHIRVSSKQELRQRVAAYLEELNQAPVVFRWKHGLDELRVA